MIKHTDLKKKRICGHSKPILQARYQAKAGTVAVLASVLSVLVSFFLPPQVLTVQKLSLDLLATYLPFGFGTLTHNPIGAFRWGDQVLYAFEQDCKMP